MKKRSTRPVRKRALHFGALAGMLAMICASTVARAQVQVDFPIRSDMNLPAYDRVDGLSFPFGATLTMGKGRLVAEPVLSYRSHLGNVDPGLTIRLMPDSLVNIALSGSRGTFTNERWIRSDWINSLASLVYGSDARNYFRADRAEARVTFSPVRGDSHLELFGGARLENGWSTGWRAGEKRGPFSILGRNDDRNGIDRPNPLIDRGHISSLLGGAALAYVTDRVDFNARGLLESAWDTPTVDQFRQLTVYQELSLATILGESLELAFRGVTTGSNPAPLQRFAYVGGSGTLATVDILPMGGDHMYFVDAFYRFPIPGGWKIINGLFVGPRFASGAADVGHYGVPTQNIGIRFGASIIRFDFVVNPRTHKKDFGYGISFSR